MPFPIPIKERVWLGLMEDRHAESLFECIRQNDSHLRQWLPWLDELHSARDCAYQIGNWRRGYETGQGFSIGLLIDQIPIGLVAFHGFDRIHRTTSLGYWLAKDVEGHGYMTEAVRACCAYAIEQRQMHRIVLRAATGNHRSRAVAHRLGFTHEGTHREAEWLYDHFVDLEVYSLLDREWKTARS